MTTAGDSTGTYPPLLASCDKLVQPNGTILGSEVATATRKEYPTLLSTIPPATNSGPVFIASLDGRLPITHSEAFDFIQAFGSTLHSFGVGRGQRVAIVLPNGPELALAILAVSQWTGCVPLSATGAVSELEADLARCGPDLVIGPYSNGPLPQETSATTTPSERLAQRNSTPATRRNRTLSSSSSSSTLDSDASAGLFEFAELTHVLQGDAPRDWTVHHHVKEVADKMKISFAGLVPDPNKAGPFKLWVPVGRRTKVPLVYPDLPAIPVGAPNIDQDMPVDEAPNSGHDEALILFTSGTTGNKKLVPHQIGDLLTAATVIALSWQLKTTDVNCNLMPLFHVGGIVRQVFSPLVSGSCVICCPNFDASLFWALLQKSAFNWYYAAPTMHSVILQTGQELLGDGNRKYKLKMIANAAGGLLPSLAQELRQTFSANGTWSPVSISSCTAKHFAQSHCFALFLVLPSYGMTECMPISSPPATYDLSKPGTSGVPVGPEVAILNVSTVEKLPPMQEGPICVRGEPCFRGYGVLANDPAADKPASFLKDAWFNTGDLGYLDEDGYLYITGRSKEVINRGGEIIPPMEVEEAVLGHPDIKACAAFSVPHDVLQETVGIVVVLQNDSVRKLDLPTLHTFIADKLAAPKWPQCLIYMSGGLPKSHTNKLLRVKLGSRLGLPELNDVMSTWERTFEANCPPQGTPLTDPIPSKLVQVDASDVQATLRSVVASDEIWVVPHPSRPGAVVAYILENGVDRQRLIDLAFSNLARYEVPTHVCFVDGPPDVEKLAFQAPNPKDAVASLLNRSETSSDPQDTVTVQIIGMFVELLNLDYVPTLDANFFHIGGSSMVASQLAGKIRKAFDVSCTGAEIFHHATPQELATAVKQRQNGGEGSENDSFKVLEVGRNDHDAPFAQTYLPPEGGLWSNIAQFIPLFVVFPIWQIARYLLLFTLQLEKSRYFPKISDRDIVSFLLAYLVYHIIWVTFVPLIFVAIKWIVIGRYRAGRYAIRGSYYNRWWFVDVCRKLFLRGIWGSNEAMLRTYYRMLGADIGPGASISPECDLAEYDLVQVGRDASVELCTLRGFGVDNGAMILGPVRVGHKASVGLRSVVAPYTKVADGEHLGPVTSTYDDTPGGALNKQHARVNRQCFPQPSLFLQVLVGGPVICLVQFFSFLPPLTILYFLLWFKSREGGEHFFDNWNEIIAWLCDPHRLPFFISIRLVRALLSPFLYMAAAIFVKKTIIGKFKVGPRKNSDWEKFRYWLAASLFTKRNIQKCTELMGRHYECVSTLYRMLGSKIGKRVFWPGNQPVTDGTFDLLEIGDDVVFGSRSAILCTTIDCAERVVICAGANVSDNCVVMAGSVVGVGAVLGSNSLCPEGKYLASGSVWFGSNGCSPTCLQTGDGKDNEYYQTLNEESTHGAPTHAVTHLDSRALKMEGDENTLRPFGKAFYLGQASGYTVLSLRSMILFTLVNRTFQVVFHVVPLLAAVQFAGVLLYSDDIFGSVQKNSPLGYFEYNDGVEHDKFLWWVRDYDNYGHYHTFTQVYVAILACFVVVHFVRVLLWLVIELSAKWIIMGRRQPGRYNYDTSSYAQRWELYQLVAKIRKLSRLNLLQFIAGTPFLNWYFRMNGCKVGKECCLYPSGADPLMPEPDLVTIGDGCVVDCASIVCHLNTKGNFELQNIVIEDKCTLRTRSRIQQGVLMETGSQLLEKSLAMTGEVIDSRSVWQGGPASMWFRYKDEDLVSYLPPSGRKPPNDAEVEMKQLNV